MHLDGDKLNNGASNLAYGTRSQNIKDTVRHGTNRNVLKTQCPAGHPYDAVNTEYHRRGYRTCKPCRQASRRRYKDRQAALASAFSLSLDLERTDGAARAAGTVRGRKP